MTLTSRKAAGDPGYEEPTFGAGGSEPYAEALRSESDVLYLRRTQSSDRPQPSTIDAGRWSADADSVDLSLLAGVAGPLLDIGCGPGRMVRAAMDYGLTALGIDVMHTAVRIAGESGVTAIHRSVFDPLPLEGLWRTALLIDGNIGIGGDPAALLARCTALLTLDGVLLVEVSDNADRDLTYDGTIEDGTGRRSDAFPWAEVGVTALRRHALGAGLVVAQDWRSGGRWFARLVRA